MSKRRNLKNLSLVVPESAFSSTAADAGGPSGNRLSRSAPSTPPMLPRAGLQGVAVATAHPRQPPATATTPNFRAGVLSTPRASQFPGDSLAVLGHDGPPPSAVLALPGAGQHRKFSEASTYGMDLSLIEDPYAFGPVQIMPGLWLGTEINARDGVRLRELNIGWVLCVAKEVHREYADCEENDDVLDAEYPEDKPSIGNQFPMDLDVSMVTEEPLSPRVIHGAKMERLLAKLMEEDMDCDQEQEQTADNQIPPNPDYVGRGINSHTANAAASLGSMSLSVLSSSAPAAAPSFARGFALLPGSVWPAQDAQDAIGQDPPAKKKKRRGGRGRRGQRRTNKERDSSADVSSASAASSRNSSPVIAPTRPADTCELTEDNVAFSELSNRLPSGSSFIRSSFRQPLASSNSNSHLTPDVLKPSYPGMHPRSPSPLGRHMISADEGDGDVSGNAGHHGHESRPGHRGATGRRSSKSGIQLDGHPTKRSVLRRLSGGASTIPASQYALSSSASNSAYNSPKIYPASNPHAPRVPIARTSPPSMERPMLGSIAPPRHPPGQSARIKRMDNTRGIPSLPITTTPPPGELPRRRVSDEGSNSALVMSYLRNVIDGGTPSSAGASRGSSPVDLADVTTDDGNGGAGSDSVLEPPAQSRRQRPFRYRKYSWGHNQENLVDYFPEAFDFIDRARSSRHGGVLVHCQMGVSRSASLVLAYVMREHMWRLSQAYDYVKDRSWVISPNMSLVYQLAEFEKVLGLRPHEDDDDLPSESKIADAGPMSAPVKTHGGGFGQPPPSIDSLRKETLHKSVSFATSGTRPGPLPIVRR